MLLVLHNQKCMKNYEDFLDLALWHKTTEQYYLSQFQKYLV